MTIIEKEYQLSADYPTFQADPMVELPDSVFAKRKRDQWRHRFDVQIAVTDLVAGTPSNERVAEGWLRTRLQGDDAALAALVEKTMTESGKDLADATESTIQEMAGMLNVFKRNTDGQLIFEGRNVKAAIKEACMVALAAGHFGAKVKWGKTGKGLLSFVSEHVMVPERQILICSDGKGTPHGSPNVQQRFVHTFRGSSITYEEICPVGFLNFTIMSDWDFEEDVKGFWEKVMVTGEEQGIGACRSLSYGRYVTTLFEPV